MRFRDRERAWLRGLAGVEVEFLDEHDYLGFVRDFLSRTTGHKSLIQVEHTSAPRTPVRSHKGLFYEAPHIRAGTFSQFEIDIDAGHTHFVGLVAIDRSNLDECVARFGDGTARVRASYPGRVPELRQAGIGVLR